MAPPSLPILLVTAFLLTSAAPAAPAPPPDHPALLLARAAATDGRAPSTAPYSFGDMPDALLLRRHAGAAATDVLAEHADPDVLAEHAAVTDVLAENADPDALLLGSGAKNVPDFFNDAPPPPPDYAPTTDWWSVAVAAAIVVVGVLIALAVYCFCQRRRAHVGK